MAVMDAECDIRNLSYGEYTRRRLSDSAKVITLKDGHRRLVETNRRAASNRLIERDRTERRAQRERDLVQASYRFTEMPPGARDRLRRRPPTEAERRAMAARKDAAEDDYERRQKALAVRRRLGVR
jgi:hypothetical protein